MSNKWGTHQYGYSDRNRLVNVNQIDNNICVNRAYTFDNTGNRTQKVTSLLNADNNLCGIPISGETPVTESLSYNDYSQITNTGYVYDIFGRATTIPSSDTASGTGNVTIGYSIEDRILNQKQGATQTDYNYDAQGRRYQDKQNTVVQVTRHYSDESDNPNWVTSGPAGAITQTDVFTPSLGSSLNITRTTKTGVTTAYLNFANLHGDTITSLAIPTTGYVSAPTALNVFDEYGVNQPIDPASLQAGSTYADTRNLFINNYGSLGQAQRETTDTGIQFMGARGYNPTTGQFLTPDPVRGGNETPYNYPNDPCNGKDLTGLADNGTVLAVNIVTTALSIALVGAICASTAGLGCLVSGLVINGIAGLTTGAVEADSMGLKGSDRDSYMFESAAFGAISSGFGFSAARGIGLALLRSGKALRSFARAPKIVRKLSEIVAGEVPSWLSNQGFNSLRSRRWAGK